MIEILVALLAGLVGGILSRWIRFPKKVPDLPQEVGSLHHYTVTRGAELFYEGGDLHMAKIRRQDNPGSVLIADGVNRG